MVQRVCQCVCMLTIGLAASVSTSLSAAEPVSKPVAAAWADDFVDAVGVNVHWIDNGGPYNKGFDAIKTKLAEAGIRHLRDGALPNAYRRGTQLYDELGVRTTFIHGVRTGQHSAKHPEYKSPLVPSKAADGLTPLRTQIPVGAIAAIEGPNEYDLFHDDRDPKWATTLREYQTELYRAVKADPVLKDVPVVGPSLTSHDACRAVGDLSEAMDFGCGHFYRSTRYPGTAGWGGRFDFPPYGGGLYGSMDYNIASARLVCGRKPIWSTETGYATHADGLSETVQTKYVPRLFAEFFRLGLRRTHHYELLDEGDNPKHDQANFGLLRHDYSEKPAFVALKGLLNLLVDNRWDATAKKWSAPAFRPGSLDYRLSGDVANIRQVLLQKRDGDFFLLLWQEVADPKFHHETWQPKFERDAKVKLTIATPLRPRAVAFSFDHLGRLSERAVEIENGAVSIGVPDRVVVVRLTPDGSKP